MNGYQDIRVHVREGRYKGVPYEIRIRTDGDAQIEGIRVSIGDATDAIIEHRPRFKSVDDAFAEAQRRIEANIDAA